MEPIRFSCRHQSRIGRLVSIVFFIAYILALLPVFAESKGLISLILNLGAVTAFFLLAKYLSNGLVHRGVSAHHYEIDDDKFKLYRFGLVSEAFDLKQLRLIVWGEESGTCRIFFEQMDTRVLCVRYLAMRTDELQILVQHLDKAMKEEAFFYVLPSSSI